MGTKLAQSPSRHFSRDEFFIFDDFTHLVTQDLWTTTAVATGTVTAPATGGSYCRLFSTADNDAAVLATTGELFNFTPNKNMYAEALLGTITRPGTNNDGFAFGFADAMAATLVADDGAGFVVANEGAFLGWLESETTWSLYTEMAGIGSVTQSTTDIASDQLLALDVTWVSSTEFQVRPFVDGVQLEDSGGVPICHTITDSASTDMDFGAVYKGHNAADGIVLIDYVYAAQAR